MSSSSTKALRVTLRRATMSVRKGTGNQVKGTAVFVCRGIHVRRSVHRMEARKKTVHRPRQCCIRRRALLVEPARWVGHRLASDKGRLVRAGGEFEVALCGAWPIVRRPRQPRDAAGAVIERLRGQAQRTTDFVNQPCANVWDTNCCNCAAFSAPDWRAISRPCCMITRVGMLRILKRCASPGCASVSIFASRTRGSKVRAA